MSEWGEKAEASFDPGDYATPLATYLGGTNDLRNHLLDGETVTAAARNRDVIAVGEDSGVDPAWVVRTVIEAALTAALGEDEGDEQ